MLTLTFRRPGARPRRPAKTPGKGSYLLVLAFGAAVACPAAAAPLVSPCTGVEGRAGVGRVFLLDPATLSQDRTALQARGEAALRHPVRSVMDKTQVPPSGDRHDYMSLAPYWWPDPVDAKAPWVRRDGEVNPARATAAFDRVALGTMAADVEALAFAYHATRERRFADRAAVLVRAWFLDPATAMNPNMNFAQAVPGRASGRAEGVLDGSAFQQVIDAVGLLAPAGTITPVETRALEAWFSRYADWMRTSSIGQAERAAANNHGLWYDSQLLHYALFARRLDVARQVVDGFPARLTAQMAPNGSLPRELARTRSFHYSLYALEPAFNVADLATCLGRDLWQWTGPQGQSLQRATDFVASFRHDPASWPYRELGWPADELDRLLSRADRTWPSRYAATSSR
jgi:hypothetical protein